MKTRGSFLVLLILGTIAVGEKNFEDVARKAICRLECPDKHCVQKCTPNPREIKVLDEDARANATFVCRDVNYIVLAHNPGLFIIEHRLTPDGNWSNPVMSTGNLTSLRGLPETLYQYRFYRVFPEGVSRDEETDWFETMLETEAPMEVSNITEPIIEVNPNNPLRLKAEISFTPAENGSCFYEVVCLDSQNHNTLVELKNPVEFDVTFWDLKFDTEYLVTVASRTLRQIPSEKTTMTFSTPRCLDFYRNLTLCVPAVVTGLNATTTRKTGNIFDVTVTWELPELIPDLYNIWLEVITARGDTPMMQNVSGTITQAVFSNVTIVEQFDVIIQASSPAGDGPSIFERFAVPLIANLVHTTTDAALVTKFATIVLTFFVCVVLIVCIVLYAYHRHGKRERSRNRLKYFESLDRKDADVKTIKDVGELEPGSIIAGVKSLLVPVDEYEIDPDRLEIKRILGTGAFGVVKLGSLRDDRGQVTAVAIKMLRDDPNEEDLRSFELEIKMMKSAGQHPNIVSLLGCCTVGPRPLLVVEYCSRGDLQSFLRAILEKATVSVNETKQRRASNPKSTECNKVLENNWEESLSVSVNSEDEVQVSSFVANRAYDIDREAFRETDMVTVTDLLNFGRQIATGMEFLSSNRVVHRDLAARNVLVCNDRTVKISDFGLSRDVYQENVYKKQGNGRVPVKWMAIEALTHQVYSTYSDVWSFGILLWEIVTLGSSPYPDIPANGVLKRLRSGYRMERPANCSIPLYNVMLSCWQTKPRDRPTFTVLRQELDKLISMAADNEYLDLSDVSKGTIREDENLQASNSRYTYFPLQLRYMNDLEPRIIDESQK